MRFRPGFILVVIGFGAICAIAQNKSVPVNIDRYIRPYVDSGNFAGVVLVERRGKVIFNKAYGFANREHRIHNSTATRFHIASVSMQITAATVLRLVDAGSINLDEHVDTFVPEVRGADKITVRDLLTQRSGLPDINALPDYNDVLQHHQTPSSLIAKIAGKPLLFEPGSKFLHEEHSAYNLLALIVEKRSGVPFATAVDRLLLSPLGLHASGVDDDSLPPASNMAKGYEPEGTYALRLARDIHWSAKAGNASAFTTTGDVSRWISAQFNGRALTTASRNLMLETSPRVGYGWFRGRNERFSEAAYYMNGRAPGFASFVLYLPESKLTVVVLSNIYSSATTTLGFDLAAVSLGLPYQQLYFGKNRVSPDKLKTCAGTFQFGPDFYQANAEVTLVAQGNELSMRWPSGEISALIPVGADQFVDRSYWMDVKIGRDSSGQPAALTYDKFRGIASRSR
jgi:CubicO group peptidase (beta-lactamase class C family)